MENSLRENTCVVCFRNITIYAVGDCDHYDRICYICSTRLRVLCNKYDCPICRKDIPKVIFSKYRQPYGALSKIDYSMDHKYKIAFVDDAAREDYESLLEHACQMCPNKQVFRSFGHLKDHVRKDHELFYCELCVENLKLFTHERRCYTRRDLGLHRRCGDTDDTSYKGHPGCQICEQRFMDKDELFRHLRKDHFFCHFCDNEGKYLFYGEYKYLEDHFREEHFLCEEGSCKDEKFTGAFRSQIDLKAHKAVQHCKMMNKQQAKQARTLELEFTYRTRTNQPNSDPFDPSVRRGGRKGPGPRPARELRPPREIVTEELTRLDTDLWSSSASAPDTHCKKEFPQLGDTVDGAPSEEKVSVSVVQPKQYGRKYNASSEEDFPSLSGNPAIPNTMTSTKLVMSSPKPSTNSLLFKINKKDKGGGGGNISIQVSSKPNSISRMSQEDFPSLSSGQPTNRPLHNSAAAVPKIDPSKMAASKLVSKNTNQDTRPVAKAPKPKFEDDFPQLLGKPGKSISSLTIPVGAVSSWTKPVEAEETAKKRVETAFTVVKGKSTKKSEKSGQSEQEAKVKTKDGTQKKESSKKKEKSKKEEKPPELTLAKSSSSEKKVPQASGGDIIEADTGSAKTNSDLASRSNRKVEAISDNSNSTQEPLSTVNVTKEDHSDKVKPVKVSKEPISDNDFPPLAFETSKKVAPPGFSIKTNTNSNNPPPGFLLTNSQAPLNLGNNNVVPFSLSTFPSQLTTSGDLSSSPLDLNNITSVPKLTRATYIEPSNFEDRNRALIIKIRDVLDGDEIAFTNFKSLSGQFRQSMVQAKEYYDKCIGIFGKEKFLKVFPELLVLLPDIGKEQELLNVYNQVSKKENQSYGAVPKSTVLNSQNNLHVLVCATCQQVLAAKDFQSHMLYHNEDASFPPLGGSNHSTSAHITWVKK